jgi:hypothetical protein
MNDRPFQIQLVDAVVGEGTVIELSISPQNKFRRLWCFFDNTSMTAAGDAAWIRFYLRGEPVTEIPAVLILGASFAVRCALGTAVYSPGISSPTAYNTNANVTGRNVIWYNNTDNNPFYAVHPFDLLCEADTVRLESNKAGITRAMLAVLSTPESVA